jgi:hypothetical protein
MKEKVKKAQLLTKPGESLRSRLSSKERMRYGKKPQQQA